MEAPNSFCVGDLKKKKSSCFVQVLTKIFPLGGHLAMPPRPVIQGLNEGVVFKPDADVMLKYGS